MGLFGQFAPHELGSRTCNQQIIGHPCRLFFSSELFNAQRFRYSFLQSVLRSSSTFLRSPNLSIFLVPPKKNREIYLYGSEKYASFLYRLFFKKIYFYDPELKSVRRERSKLPFYFLSPYRRIPTLPDGD